MTTCVELGIAPVVLAVRGRKRASGVHGPAQPIAFVGLAVRPP